MSRLARALLDELDDGDLEALAERLAPYLPTPEAEDRWLDVRGAADHLALTRDGIHKLTATRGIPFVQDVPGGKCYFRRSDLDRWRMATAS